MQDERGTEDLLSVKEVCELTGIKPARLLRKIRKGEIAAQKIGWVWVIRRETAEALITEE